MTELDDMLRGSFARIAEPGDPTGVAAAIQSRVDSGDTGTPASSSGFGGGLRPWLPWIGLAIVVAITGGAVGASGVLTPPPPTTSAVSAEPQAPASPSADPSPSADSSSNESSSPTPSPTPEPPTAPAPPAPASAPAADVTAPTLANASASPSSGVCADDGYAAYYPITSTIAVYAADAVGVTGVRVSWPMATAPGQDEMTGGPANWSYSFNPAQSTPSGTVVITLQARDAAGNLSAPVTTTVDVIAANSCLI